MPGSNIYNSKDLDGRWWRFRRQKMDMSCGPTSVAITKELFHNQPFNESAARGMVGLQYLAKANTGKSLAQADADTKDRWEDDGSIEHKVLPAVKASPLGIPGAKFAKGVANLRKASRNHPAILGFNWASGGGHFVVCVGPTKKDPTKFVILDPDGGLNYVTASDSTADDDITYNPGGEVGTIDSVGFIVT